MRGVVLDESLIIWAQREYMGFAKGGGIGGPSGCGGWCCDLPYQVELGGQTGMVEKRRRAGTVSETVSVSSSE